MFNRVVLFFAVLSVFAMLAMWADAAGASEPPRAPSCKVVYINGDAVIRCPRLVRSFEVGK